MALLTVAPGGLQTPTDFTVYGIMNNLAPDWKETGKGHLNWDTAPCRNGISGQKYLGRLTFDNTKDRLINKPDAVRFASRELDDFIRDAKGKPVTLVFIPDTKSNRPARFKSKEGQPNDSPAIALRYLQNGSGGVNPKDTENTMPTKKK